MNGRADHPVPGTLTPPVWTPPCACGKPRHRDTLGRTLPTCLPCLEHTTGRRMCRCGRNLIHPGLTTCRTCHITGGPNRRAAR